MIEKIDTGAHVAYVDAVAGVGVLVAPNRNDDMELPGLPVETSAGVSVPGMESLQDASLGDVMRRVVREGWAPLEDDDEEVMALATTASGKTAYGLVPAAADPGLTLDQFFAEYAEWERHVLALLELTGDDWTMTDDFKGDGDGS